MDRPEIRGDKSLKSPLIFENFVLQDVIFAAMVSVYFRIRRHHRRHVALSHRCFKGGQINFVQSPFVDDFIDGKTLCLLVVGGVMFDVGNFALALNALDFRNGHPPNQVRVFAKGFEGAAVLRGARDIDGRGFDTEQNRPTNLQIPLVWK